MEAMLPEHAPDAAIGEIHRLGIHDAIEMGAGTTSVASTPGSLSRIGQTPAPISRRTP